MYDRGTPRDLSMSSSSQSHYSGGPGMDQGLGTAYHPIGPRPQFGYVGQDLGYGGRRYPTSFHDPSSLQIQYGTCHDPRKMGSGGNMAF